ncbi:MULTISPECIES: hypothetical protein [unclassified Rhizobium]|uniref:hypothetical protein n=1 Tax=unclassified Rhizobium TaxID=2613769 RepID=UPI00115DE1B7|nr:MULTISPECIES: hypothetical protein [unclassified Rhizobium]TQX90245.1 hypothetical protein EQW76_11115 [Rhizobium sp. rho-13.1]TQY16195.1 hypothetical protein EQW74_10705 [Rhizobium sp. rho-1.1]
MFNQELIHENTAKSVIAAITQGNMYLPADLEMILHDRFQKAKHDQIAKGVTFNLTFEEFLALIGSGKRSKLRRQFNQGTLVPFFKSWSGYCLSWKDRTSFRSKIMDASTAVYTTRRMSKRVNQFEKGDTHTEASKARISASKTGKPRTKKAKKAISNGLMGHEVSAETRAKQAAAKLGKTKSPEERARISASMKATKAAKRTALAQA